MIRKIILKFHYLCWLCLCLLVIDVNAQENTIYKTIDKNGRIVFTDNPPLNEKAESIDLKETNVQPGGQSSSYSHGTQPRQNQSMSISIVAPAIDARLGPADKNVTFRARVNSPLAEDDGVVFYFDGKALNAASSALSYTMPLSIKIRGQHVVKAVVVNKKTGATVAVSSPVAFYVLRPTS